MERVSAFVFSPLVPSKTKSDNEQNGDEIISTQITSKGDRWRAVTTLGSQFCFRKRGANMLLTSFGAFVPFLSLEILKDLDGQALLAACWLVSHGMSLL